MVHTIIVRTRNKIYLRCDITPNERKQQQPIPNSCSFVNRHTNQSIMPSLIVVPARSISHTQPRPAPSRPANLQLLNRPSSAVSKRQVVLTKG